MSQRIEQASRDTAKTWSIRFNTDSSKLEIQNGEQWWDIDATSTQQQTGGRGIFFGGGYTSTNIIDFVNIESTGDET